LHHSWSRRFCSKHCKQVYREQKRWPAFGTHFSLGPVMEHAVPEYPVIQGRSPGAG
jgi:hypothetical protein